MEQELLAPAGSLETFYAVIAAGANAVYLGGPKFGARAYAKNFTESECLTAISYAHLKNVKVYMTVNTLVKNEELKECIESLRIYYEAGLDGVIVQDFGVLQGIHNEYPDMEIHASTQMSVSNVSGAKLLKKLGVTRVVPSRELSLKEIQQIRKEADIEVETFIHGALCYSYSGQCLMSSLIGGRSGNRGRCAQPCRLPYELLDKKGNTVCPAATLLSLKDLAMLNHLQDLADIPIDSLKIEGRMKQTEYAYQVVSLYRKYLDLCVLPDHKIKEDRPVIAVSKQDWKALLDTGNREGFTSGYYYTRNDSGMITKNSSAHKSSNEQSLPPEITCPQQEFVEGYMEVYLHNPLILNIKYKNETYCFNGPVVEEALKRPTTREEMEKQMKKTGNLLFAFSKLQITGDENVFLPVSVLNKFRRDVFDQLLMKILVPTLRKAIPSPEVITYQGNKRNKELESMPGTDDTHIFLSVSGNTREHLSTLLKQGTLKRIYLELDSYRLPKELEILCKDIRSIYEAKKECYLAFPYIFRHDYERILEDVWEILQSECTGFMVRSLDSLGFLLKKKESNPQIHYIADETLYCYSNLAEQVFANLGCEGNTVPYELNKAEILHRNNQDSEMVVYGRLPVMITANCVKKTNGFCSKEYAKDASIVDGYYLKDRKNALFYVETNCNNCGNIIYNSVPLYLMEQDVETICDLHRYRIHITDESTGELEDIFKRYRKYILNENLSVSGQKNVTYGHFKRGVE